MPLQSSRFDFEDGTGPIEDFVLHENIISDRGSIYSVSYGKVHNRGDIREFIKKLKRNKRYAKATHNTWAARISREGAIFETKSDDGETGAGMIILRSMQKEEVQNCVICVTRWFGGTKLMGDRFKHVQTAAVYAINTFSWDLTGRVATMAIIEYIWIQASF